MAAIAYSRARRCSGFSLLELLVAGVIASVLAGIAYPAFAAQIAQARRADARVALFALQLAQERWRAERLRYGDATEIGAAPVSDQGHYDLQVTPHGAAGYTLLATARGAQSRDVACRHLRLMLRGAVSSHASGPDAALGNAAPANRRCWGT